MRGDGEAVRLFALLGHPLTRSRSPALQRAALGPRAAYVRIWEREPQRALELCRLIGCAGANVTAPFKETLARSAACSGAASTLGAVNTLVFEAGQVLGFNTDPEGVWGAVSAFEPGGAPLRRAVVLGAGGAAKAAALALADRGVQVTVANRHVARAARLAELTGARPLALSDARLPACIGAADLLVSAVSTAEATFDPACLTPGTRVLDAIYGIETALSRAARARGCRFLDGREWLLHQGAASFERWLGRPAPIRTMRQALAAPQGGLPSRGLALVGFSGAGKSTLARSLEGALGLPVRDLDEAIVRHAGCAVARIFETSGEAAFRQLERERLRALAEEPSILALGGGALLDARNRSLAREGRLVLWLCVDQATALARLAGEGRPLMDSGDRSRRAAALMDARREGYALSSDWVLDATRPIEETRQAVIELWRELEQGASER